MIRFPKQIPEHDVHGIDLTSPLTLQAFEEDFLNRFGREFERRNCFALTNSYAEIAKRNAALRREDIPYEQEGRYKLILNTASGYAAEMESTQWLRLALEFDPNNRYRRSIRHDIAYYKHNYADMWGQYNETFNARYKSKERQIRTTIIAKELQERLLEASCRHSPTFNYYRVHASEPPSDIYEVDPAYPPIVMVWLTILNVNLCEYDLTDDERTHATIARRARQLLNRMEWWKHVCGLTYHQAERQLDIWPTREAEMANDVVCRMEETLRRNS